MAIMSDRSIMENVMLRTREQASALVSKCILRDELENRHAGWKTTELSSTPMERRNGPLLAMIMWVGTSGLSVWMLNQPSCQILRTAL